MIKMKKLAPFVAYSFCAITASVKAESLEERIGYVNKQLKAQSTQIENQKRELIILRKQAQKAFVAASLASRIKWDGFFTAAVSQVDVDEQVQWGNDGPDNELDWSSDTMIGLQARFKISEELQIVSQMISKGGYDSYFDADWFYLQYAPNENFDMMVGRIRPQFFMLSDYIEVGFAYPWIRPPEEVYDPIPSDWGQGISFNFSWESWSDTYHNAAIQLIQLEDQGTVSRFDATMVGVMYEFNVDALTVGLRGGKMKADIFLQSDSFRDASAALEALDEEVAILANENADLIYANVGIRYETESWLAMGEWSIFEIDGLFVDTESYYMTLGRRFGKWMPHLTYAHHESTDNDIREDPRIIEALGPATGAVIQSVAQGLWNQQNDSYTLGINYSLNSNATIKFEAKLITERDGTVAQFQKSQTTNEVATVVIPEKEDIYIYGIAVDMIF